MDAAVHTHTTFIELTSFDQMHRHVGCDGCGRMSMVGSRYKCMDCPNFDLCQKCIASARDAHVPGHWFNRLDARERFARRVVSLAASLKTKDEVPLEQRVGPCVFAREETLLNMTIEAEVMEEKVEIGAEEAAGAVELTCKQAVEEHDLARSASEVTFKQDFAGSASEMTFKQAVERDLARSASSATSTSIASSVHSRVVPISYAKVAATLSPAAPTPVMPGSFPIVLPAPIHPPVTGNTEVPILESGTAANDYAQQQVALFEMGFMNPSVNFEVLARCNGDLVKATEELIEKGPAAREILEDGDEEESGDRYDSLEWRALF
ncbi:hypothetical protein BC830DRAFT_238837 [Chytriomyces sp. MP71]|nr:hypothetical protein BC830DRAFT_238837 [Chytriomyces sp. MP71]